MKQRGGSDEAKRRAGESAAEIPEDGDVVGLGTGSTAAHAIRSLGERVDAGLDVRGIPTSFQSRQVAREAGIPLTSLDEADPDVAIDGADEVAPDGALIKGGGAAHAREKLVDSAAERFVVVADPSKEADALSHAVPIEVLPDARVPVADAVRSAGGDPELRAAERKDGPVVTDNGNLVLDCAFGEIDAPNALARTLSVTPGVVEHGLFVGLADELHVGDADGVEITRY
ncbi:ribose-5-phosphate isomerase RpiA [Halolamina litorea]|uniref:Ribose-5-phosphate isomerase A n=1 Tax=Halolamina litorea TaxID=1515593 RepID=A0ABD6BVS3_9EURY|nr:ribose-5-phosphate isomerase RpiA [Halolamina litorea]